MRVFRSVAAALLQRFLSTGQNTFDGIEQYTKTACIYATGPHWVGNFLLPTLLIHQFDLRSHIQRFQFQRLFHFTKCLRRNDVETDGEERAGCFA